MKRLLYSIIMLFTLATCVQAQFGGGINSTINGSIFQEVCYGNGIDTLVGYAEIQLKGVRIYDINMNRETPASIVNSKYCNRAEVYVVRLNGNTTGVSIPKLEGQTVTVADVGNTFTLSGEYVSYVTQWLGDSVQDAILNWNGLQYLAGLGSGSATYQHALLPALTDSENNIHNETIVLTADPGAFIEFRFKRLK
jgi:hypothetical protein